MVASRTCIGALGQLTNECMRFRRNLHGGVLQFSHVYSLRWTVVSDYDRKCRKTEANDECMSLIVGAPFRSSNAEGAPDVAHENPVESCIIGTHCRLTTRHPTNKSTRAKNSMQKYLNIFQSAAGVLQYCR